MDFQYFKYEFMAWWERRSIRPWVNQNPLIFIGITIVSLVALFTAAIWVSIPDKVVEVIEYDYDWYYDLNTGKLFTAVSGKIPPIKAPSGPLPDGKPAGVRAYVFSYTKEPNAPDKFIGFLETTDPNVPNHKRINLDLRYEGSDKWAKGRLVRRVEDEMWFPANSPIGRAVMRKSFRPNKNGKHPNYCPPK